jgi:hypothetical protein
METQVVPIQYSLVATNVFRAPVLAKYRLTYQAFPRDLRMTTTAWTDSYLAIAANNILVSTDDEGKAVSPDEIKAVFAGIKDMHMKCASTRYAVVAGPDNRMWLHGAPVCPGYSYRPDVEADLCWVSGLS